jgi:N-acyl-D-aspartate/D-glutamate deacylase
VIDILIKGGTVVDGTGKPSYKGDVAIESGKIADIGNLASAAASRTIDATGQIVSPGFIDTHTHTDRTIILHHGATSSVVQGITTEVASNCGTTMAPQNELTREAFTRNNIAKVLGPQEAALADLAYSTVAGYLETLERQGIGINVVTMVGQGSVRGCVMGLEAKRPATTDEITAMKKLVTQGLEEGAWGFSTGRNIAPGSFASTDETIEVAKAATPFHSSYFTHIGALPTPGQTLKALDEAIEIAQKAKLHLQVAHLGSSTSGWESDNKPGSIAGSVRGRALRAIEKLDNQAKDGMDLVWDAYPYNFSGAANPFDIMPPELAFMDRKKALASLASKETRDWLRGKMTEPESGRGMSKLEWIVVGFVIACPPKPEIEGKCIWDMAVEQNKDPLDFVCDLLIETDGQLIRSAEHIHEENLQSIYRHPLAMPSSDGWALDRPLPPDRTAHPRHAGSMVRFFGRYWREKKLFSLEEAVRKATSAPAKSIGLKKRGALVKGNFADLVVFDPEKIADKATFQQPFLRPVGVQSVLVNGVVAVDNGNPTGKLGGRALRRGMD